MRNETCGTRRAERDVRNETSNPPIPGKKTDKPERARMSEGGANAPPSEADLARALQLAAHEALGGGGDAGEHLERLHRMQLAHSERTAGVERKYEAASLELERALAENEGLRGDVSRLSHDLMASKEHTRMSLTSALERIEDEADAKVEEAKAALELAREQHAAEVVRMEDDLEQKGAIADMQAAEIGELNRALAREQQATLVESQEKKRFSVGEPSGRASADEVRRSHVFRVDEGTSTSIDELSPFSQPLAQQIRHSDGGFRGHHRRKNSNDASHGQRQPVIMKRRSPG